MTEIIEPDGFEDGKDFDLDAAVSAQLEAKRRPINVRMGGRLIPFPQMSDWPWEAVEAMNEGKLLEALANIFGDDPLDPDDADAGTVVAFFRDLPVDAVRKLFEHFASKSGVMPGESNRSARRSRSTTKR